MTLDRILFHAEALHAAVQTLVDHVERARANCEISEMGTGDVLEHCEALREAIYDLRQEEEERGFYMNVDDGWDRFSADEVIKLCDDINLEQYERQLEEDAAQAD